MIIPIKELCQTEMEPITVTEDGVINLRFNKSQPHKAGHY